MGRLHRAWTFVPQSAHRAISEVVVEEGQVSIRKLRDVAHAVVERERDSDSPTYLEMVRFDTSWFQVEELQLGRLYVTAMEPSLTPTHHISDSGGLYLALIAFGWSEDEALELSNGEPLSTLSRIMDDPLMNLVASDLESLQFGGWLSQDRTEPLLRKLQMLEAQFYASDSDHLRFLTERTHIGLEKTRQAVIGLYESAARLLETLLELTPGTALRCIAD